MKKNHLRILAFVLCIMLTMVEVRVFADLDMGVEDGVELRENEEEYVKVEIKHELLPGQAGSQNHLPVTREKDYINLSPGGETDIKKYLDLNRDEEEIINGRYVYSLSKVGIGDVEIPRQTYENGKMKDLGIDNEDYNLFDENRSMVLYYETEVKPIEREIKVILNSKDVLHKNMNFRNEVKFKVKYDDENASLDTKYEIQDGKIKILMVDEDIEIVGTDNEKTYKGYKIHLVDKSGNEYELDLVPDKKDRNSSNIVEFADLKFENRYNKEELKKAIGFNGANELLLGDQEIGDHMEAKVLNRVENIDGKYGIEDGEIYLADKIELKLDERKSKITEKIIGNSYETERITVGGSEKLVSTVEVKEENPEAFKINFDYKRKTYRVKVNDGLEKTYDVMLGDTDELEFTNERIKSIKIKSGSLEEAVVGKKVGLNSLGENDVILIETHSNLPINEVKYSVRDVDVNGRAIGEERVFTGLEGTKLRISPIRQHDYMAGDPVELKDYKLVDPEFKQVELKYGLVVSFKFARKDRPSYRVLHVTKYGNTTSTGGRYKIESSKKDEFEILHEEQLESDFSKLAKAHPKDLAEKGFELINSNDLPFTPANPTISGGPIEGYEGYDIKYLSGDFEEKISNDTVYIYSYKKINNEIGEPLKLKLVETLDGDVENSIVLTYPRYKNNYKVVIEGIGNRNSCYSKKSVVEHFDNSYGIVKGSSKFEDGNLIFEVKGADGKPGDWFPRFSGRLENGFIGLELKYEGAGGNGMTCDKEKPFKEVKIDVKRLVLKQDGSLEDLNYPKDTISGIEDYDEELDLLSMEKLRANKINVGKDQYSYKPYADKNQTRDKFIGILDKDHKQILMEDDKVLGLDTTSLKLKDGMEMFIVYEVDEIETEPIKNYNIKVYEYKLKPQYLKNNISGSDIEFIPKVYDDGRIVIKDLSRAELHYKEYLKSLEDVYKNSVDSLEADMDTHFLLDKTGNVTDGEKSKVSGELDRLLAEVNASKRLAEKNRFRYKIADLKNLNQANMVKSDDEKVNLDDILNKLKHINAGTFYDTILNEEINFVNSINGRDNILVGDKMYTVDYKDYMPTKFKAEENNKKREEYYSDTHKYVIHRMEEWSRLPVSLSRNVINKNDVDEFVRFGEKFPVGNDKLWTTEEATKFTVNVEEEIDYLIPVVFISRSYDKYILTEIPGKDVPEEPDKNTKRNLDIIISFYDENHILKGAPHILKFENIPTYFDNLGWKIESYPGFDYINESGENLKVGDTKYSEKLENNKTTTLNIDYKGKGSLPPEPENKEYKYTIFNQDVGMAGDVPKSLGNFVSAQKYRVGLSLRYKPEKIDGYQLLKDGKISDDYGEIEIVIKDESKDVNREKANYNYIDYVKRENLINLSFDAKGGKFSDGNTIKIYRLQKGNPINTVELPRDLTRDGFKHIGWTSLKNGVYEDVDPNEILTKDTSLYSKWEEIKKPEVKYAYTIVNRDVKKFGESPIVISETKSLEVYPVGSSLKYKPIKLTGYSLFKNGRPSDDYGEIDITIKDESSLGNRANYIDVDYIKDEDVVKLNFDADGGKFRDGSSKKIEVLQSGAKLSSVDFPRDVIRDGYSFKGWFKKEGGTYKEVDKNESLKADLTLYAKWEKDSKPVEPDKGGGSSGGRRSRDKDKPDLVLNTKDHLAYIRGYEDKTVRPEDNLSREEAAMVLYRLMDSKSKGNINLKDIKFSDVEAGRWSEKAILTLAQAGMINGYEDGSFRPENNITRSELTTMVAKLTDISEGESAFEDVKGHWAEKYINSVYKKAWIKGYEDGLFRPDDFIRRSEFVSMINKVLDRKVKSENILKGIESFKDLKEDKWYYEDMVEAINGHDYEEKRLPDGSEKWIKLIDREYDK